MKQFEPGELVRLTDSHGTELKRNKRYVIDDVKPPFVTLIGHNKKYLAYRFTRVDINREIDTALWVFILFAAALAVWSLIITLNQPIP